jgi:hypothetical protein
LRIVALAVSLPTAAVAWAQAPAGSPDAQEAARRLATSDPQLQASRWGVLARMASQPWLSTGPVEISNVWRKAGWVVPGASMKFQRGFCIALQCQASDYVVQYNDQARRLEFFENGAMAYTGQVQDDGSVRLVGTGLMGVLTAETLRYDAATGAVFANQHELKAATPAQLTAATRGFVPEEAPKPAAASAADAELRAELAAMKAKVDQLSRQLEQPAPAPAPAASAPAPKLTPAQLKAKEAEEKRQAQAKAREEAQARAAEAQRLAAEKRAQAEEEKRLQAEARAREAEAKAAEARRLADEKRAQEEALRNRPYFGAIAVGSEIKNDGWAVSAITLEKAQDEALANCRRTGDTCAIVLTWSGNGCGAYRAAKDGKVWGAGVHKMNSESASRAFDDAVKRGGGASYQIRNVCNSNSATAPAEMLFSGPPPKGKQQEAAEREAQAKARADAQGGAASSRQSSTVASAAPAAASRAPADDAPIRAGTYSTGTGYSIDVRAEGDSLVVVEPNKRSEYRRIAPGSNVYRFHNPNTGSTFALTVVNKTTLMASRFNSAGEVLPNGTELRLVGGGASQARPADESTYKAMEAVAQKYLKLAQTDTANAQAWSFCGLAAMARAHGQNDQQVQQAATALKSIATTSQSPCPDAITPAVWNSVR